MDIHREILNVIVGEIGQLRHCLVRGCNFRCGIGDGFRYVSFSNVADRRLPAPLLFRTDSTAVDTSTRVAIQAAFDKYFLSACVRT